VVTALRNIRAELKLDPKKRWREFYTQRFGLRALMQENRGAIERFAVCLNVESFRANSSMRKRGGRSTATLTCEIAYLDWWIATC